MKKQIAALLFPLFRRPALPACVILLLAAASLVILFAAPFRNDISRMLPDGSESMRCYRRLASSAMFNKAPLLFHADDPAVFRTPGFAEKLRKLTDSLEKESGQILRTDWQLIPMSPDKAAASLVPYIPQYLPCGDPDPEKLVASCLKQFQLPTATGRAAMLETDPFAMASGLLLRLEHFRRVSRFSAGLDSPFITSPDGKSLLVLLETSVPATDPASGRELLNMVEGKVRDAGFVPGKEVDLLLPHRRAIANEAVVKKDILLVSILSVLIFSLLIVFIYRCDARSFLIPAVPFLAALLTAAWMPLVFRTPLFFVVGMGGIVISLALDYGIHIYSAMTGPGRFRSLIRILPPLAAAALTSGIAFLLFLFSATDAIRQLGFFSGVSLLTALLLMILLLPPALAKHRGARTGGFRERDLPALKRKTAGILWGGLLILSLAALPMLRMHSDARQFDLSPEEYDRQDERLIRDFHQGSPPALALFEGNTAEEALAASEAARRIPQAEECFFPADLCPLAQEREKNLASWRRFEQDHWEEFAAAIRAEADKNGFHPDFFTPFLESLREGIRKPPAGTPDCFQPALRRLLVPGTDGKWNAAVMYPDREEIRSILAGIPGCTVISRDHFSMILARDVAMGILPLALSAILAVALLTFLFFRSVRDTALALLPVPTALLCTAGLFAAIGKPVNIPVLTAGIILCGLAVDYGIFSVHAIRSGNRKEVFRAVTLSALTTAAGGLTVAFTRHPMLRDAGQTLIAGIAFAWFSALVLLPAFADPGKRKKLLSLILPAMLLLSGSACRKDPFDFPDWPTMKTVAETRTEIPFPENFRFDGSMVMEFPFFSMNFLCTAERKDGTFRIAGLSPAGMKLFEIAGRNGKAEEIFFLPSGKFAEDPEEKANALLRQFEYIFSGLGPLRGPLETDAEGVFLEQDGIRRAGENLDVVEKENVRYYRYRNFGKYRFPVQIVYQEGIAYRLIFRIAEAEAAE